MKITTFVRSGALYGRREDGSEIGPLKPGAKNLPLERAEYMFEGKPYYEPFLQKIDDEPEPDGGWL